MNRLDELISENAKPADIFDFLEKTNDIKSVFSESLFCKRMFQLDFFLACSNAEIDKLIDLAMRVLSAVDIVIFFKQIKLSESKKSHYAKYKYRCLMDDYLTRYEVLFIFGEKTVSELDIACVKACANGDIRRVFRRYGRKQILFFLYNIGYSLFQHRMLQADFIAALDPETRKSLIYGAFRTIPPKYLWKFIKSILGGNFDLDLKYTVLAAIRKYDINFCSRNGMPYKDIMQDGKSLQEIMLADTISGKNALDENFCMFLLTYMPAYVRGYIEYGGSVSPYLLEDELLPLADMMVKNICGPAAERKASRRR